MNGYPLKILLFFILLFGQKCPGFTQKFSLGVKGGPLMVTTYFAEKEIRKTYSNRLKLGYYGAGLIIFPLNNNWEFETELGFSQKGRRVLFNDDTWENNGTYYFVDASMMLRKMYAFNLGPNTPSNWFFNVGPHISYWLSGRGKVKAGGNYKYTVVYDSMPRETLVPDFDKMYMANVNRWFFGIDFGIGFIAPLSANRKILTELRFTSGHTYFGKTDNSSGLTSTATNRTLGFEDNLKANEKVLSLTVAYILNYNMQESRKGKSNKDKEVHRKPVKRRRR